MHQMIRWLQEDLVMRRTGFAIGLCAFVALAATSQAQTRKPVRAPARSAVRSPASQAPSVLYDFKGAKLGMTMEEWKALAFPGSQERSSLGSITYGPTVARCSDQPDAGSLYLYRSSSEQAAGVVVCTYARGSQIGSYKSWDRPFVPIGKSGSNDVEYKFYGGKLYAIDITGGEYLLAEALDGLTAKWGQPTSVVNDTTQNRMGASFPYTVKTWLNPAASIRLETPWTKISDLNILFSDTVVMAKLAAADRAANPAVDKM